MMSRNNLVAVVAVTVGILAAVSPAYAYILPADALLARMSKGRARLAIQSLVLQGTHEKDGVRTPVWEAIKPGARRRELKAADATSVVLTRGRELYTFSPGSGRVRPKRAPVDLLARLAFPEEVDSSGYQGIDLLKKLGIDASVVSFGRQDKRIVFVIGAKSNEPNKAQLWLDKELMVPVRLVQYDKQRRRLETRWLGFASPLTAPYFPRRIETWIDGELVESVTYDDINVNPRLDNALFEPPT